MVSVELNHLAGVFGWALSLFVVFPILAHHGLRLGTLHNGGVAFFIDLEMVFLKQQEVSHLPFFKLEEI